MIFILDEEFELAYRSIFTIMEGCLVGKVV